MTKDSDPAPLSTAYSGDFFDGLDDSMSINYLVAMASNLSPIASTAEKASSGSSVQEIRALGALVRLGPQTLSDLARLTRQDPANVSRTVAKLVDKALVLRMSNPEHKGSAYIWVTMGGLKLYEAMKPLMEARARHYTSGFSQAEKQQLQDLLKRYIEGAEASD